MGKNIFQRMADITNELGVVAKNLDVAVNKISSYKAVSEVDVINAVKPLEFKHGVYSYPFETNIIHQETITTKTQYGEKDSFFIRLERIYRFVNVEDGSDYIELKSYGDGLDSGDKATGKAMTYADKYALMKAYKISTGEDPDKDSSENNSIIKSNKQKFDISKATLGQVVDIQRLYKDDADTLKKSLEKARVNKIEDLTLEQAKKMIEFKNEIKKD